MKIYKLSINEVASEPSHAISSSFRNLRTTRDSEYYLSEEKALARRKEIYDSVNKILGFVPRIEVHIKELEVVE